jgi:hypothetical protein
VELTYASGVWHDPSIINLDATTNIYTCITDGCPNEGATEMKCKQGYGGPLCAVCDEGYFRSIRECTRCEHPRVGVIVGMLVGAIAIITGIRYIGQRYRRYLKSASVFAHVKVLVSFVSVAATLDTQFGVLWPSAFANVSIDTSTV